MTEHFTLGIVLDKTLRGEADSEYAIFTWDLGKIIARATSSRKTNSRLAGHLEPGTIAKIRVVRKNAEGRYRIIEALSEARTKDRAAIKALTFANSMIPLEEPDIKMFSFLKDSVASKAISEIQAYNGILKICGLDPASAKCGVCGKGQIAYFSLRDIMFLCAPCLEREKTRRKRNEETIKQKL